MMKVRGYWQDIETGDVYVIESSSFGEILSGTGPVDRDNLLDLSEYQCNGTIKRWLETAFAEGKLKGFNPAPQET